MGTALFERTMKWAENKDPKDDLMKKVWSGTPWMIDFYTDSINSERHRTIMEWCRDNFGPESWPIHEKPGSWHSGGATIHGWTWLGFETKEMLEKFLSAWEVDDDICRKKAQLHNSN